MKSPFHTINDPQPIHPFPDHMEYAKSTSTFIGTVEGVDVYRQDSSVYPYFIVLGEFSHSIWRERLSLLDEVLAKHYGIPVGTARFIMAHNAFVS